MIKQWLRSFKRKRQRKEIERLIRIYQNTKELSYLTDALKVLSQMDGVLIPIEKLKSTKINLRLIRQHDLLEYLTAYMGVIYRNEFIKIGIGPRTEILLDDYLTTESDVAVDPIDFFNQLEFSLQILGMAIESVTNHKYHRYYKNKLETFDKDVIEIINTGMKLALED